MNINGKNEERTTVTKEEKHTKNVIISKCDEKKDIISKILLHTSIDWYVIDKKYFLIIKNILSQLGYYFAKVENFVEENDNNSVNLVYNIELGEKALIDKIEFTGQNIIEYPPSTIGRCCYQKSSFFIILLHLQFN